MGTSVTGGSVAVGGGSVVARGGSVAVGGGSVVAVGGSVAVGGTGVRVGGGVLVEVGSGVRVGGRVGVRLATTTAVRVARTRLVTVGVMVTKRLGVSVGSGVREVGTGVLLGVSVPVGTKTVTICSVSAAAVPKFETARSTMLMGSSVMGI